jgi:hypothetical protein
MKNLLKMFAVSAILLTAAFAVGLTVLLIYGPAIDQQNAGPAASKESGGADNIVKWPTSEEDKVGALAEAENIVKGMLKSPSTASFGSVFGEYQDASDHVEYCGGGFHRVNGWVDSQNGFGATVRTNYRIVLLKSGGKWSVSEAPILVQN